MVLLDDQIRSYLLDKGERENEAHHSSSNGERGIGRPSPPQLRHATVLEGAIRSQVNDGSVITYRGGESWSEFPSDHHSIAENASATKAAWLLAVFVVDTDEAESTKVLPTNEVEERAA